MFLPHSFFIFVLILLANSKDFLGVILNISERFSLDFMIIFICLDIRRLRLQSSPAFQRKGHISVAFPDSIFHQVHGLPFICRKVIRSI